MKKTISINISGILFHIEEDGYASLKKYLEAINKHFSHYEDNQEIISDIENRIAEIFLSKLKNNKQVITADDVSKLIEKMGTISDFKAIEEEQENLETPKAEESSKENDFYKYITPPNDPNATGYKKLMRMEKGKILGGVCAGIAHYFSIDPLWTRLIAILLLFSGNLKLGGTSFEGFPWNLNFSLSLGLFALIAYVVLWVLLPVSFEDPDQKQIKKLYRNPDDRTLGGVASGLAAYFGIEVLWARLIFIALIFAGGSGLVIYLILWIITPMAKSITERIQMKGGAITLDNIESTILENLNPIVSKEESTFKKIILAPFRLIGVIINGLGKALGPLGLVLLSILRVLFGLLIFVIGISIAITPIAAISVYFNVIPTSDTILFDGVKIPTQWINELMPEWLAIITALIVLIPGLVLIILAISVWVKRSVIDGRSGLIALGIWLLCVGAAAFQAPGVVKEFKAEASISQSDEIEFGHNILVISTEENSDKMSLSNQIKLQITGKDTGIITLIKELRSRGKSYNDAKTNAQEIPYNYQLQDSLLILDRSLDYSKLEKFRVQELDLILEIPYDQVFILDKTTIPVIRNTLTKNGYKIRDINSKHYWVFNQDGLLCLNCSSEHKQSKVDSLSRAKFPQLTR
ncbi:PspC domain-containing protein [Belliella kenyensis]|uniref:PspC domain-containing protein n=1 Tax=Belliella kenyensis TaxID=1472724 RepID=A0ABV8EGJ9_9BACT|nr:PspC domain-containing protein [Belliella kenyensis]MCH7401004.1 PspC domain-containing protein [Belliella kenyensis]MDN3604002.1 PspC domain-containing protein [Belliella kenyensis]